jgi:serralysin
VSLDRFLAYLVGALSAVLVFAVLTTQAAPNEVGANRAAAAHMLEKVNEVRSAEGLHPLESAEDIAEVAERWSAAMAADQDMRHNPTFADEICCWSVTTENVAWSEPHRLWRPGDPVIRITDELHEALLSSPGHRANLLDTNVDQIGIGIHVDDRGNVWITQNFRGTAPAISP